MAHISHLLLCRFHTLLMTRYDILYEVNAIQIGHIHLKRMTDTRAGSNSKKGGKQMSVERMCHTGSGLIISPPSC